MNVTVALYKSVLMNAESSPERKDKVLAELKSISESDPRHADAQSVLQELRLADPISAPAQPVLTEGEKQKALDEWNALPLSERLYRPLPAAVKAACERFIIKEPCK